MGNRHIVGRHGALFYRHDSIAGAEDDVMACSGSTLKVGCRYRHYKNGQVYLLICIAINPKTDVRYVVYREFDNAELPLYLRPFGEFCKKFTLESGFWTDPHKAEGYDPYNSIGH